MSLEDRMNRYLNHLRIPLRVVWLPNKDSGKHAEIDTEKGNIVIHDEDEMEAWDSLIHEVLEWRMRPIFSTYRRIINSLIETIENLVYIEKEKVLDAVSQDLKMWRELEVTLNSHKFREQKRF